MTESAEPDAPELPFDLGTLALVTGISNAHLTKMYNGEMLPDDTHLVRLSKALDDEQLAWFQRHTAPELETVTSRYGSVPEGYDLLPYVSCSSLRVGDLIAYRPPYRVKNGAMWIQINKVSLDDKMVIVETHDTEIKLPSGKPVRIARPKEISEHDRREGAGDRRGPG